MNKLLAFLIMISFTFSCVPDSEINSPGPGSDNGNLDDLLIFQTDDSKFPIVFVYKNSDLLFARDINENGIYDGFFYKDGTYEEFLIIDEKTGLPKSKRNNEGVLILYSFKDENQMVDLSITINDETSFVRNIVAPLGNMSEKTKTSDMAKSDFEVIRDAAEAYQVASNIIGCAEGIGGFLVGTTLTAGIATVPAGLLASAKCAPLALTVAQKLLEATDTEIGQLLADDLKKVNGFVSALTCPSGLAGCTAFVVAEAANLQAKLEELQRKAEQFQKELEEILNRSAEIVIVGDLNFGKVELDDTKTEILTIYNRGDEPITITGLEVNSDSEQFIINTSFPFTLDPAGEQASKAEISITFAPQDAAQDYNTFLKISNNKYEPFDAKAITARATNEDGAKIRLSGTLSFEGVKIGMPHSEFFSIENPNLNETITVTGIEFVDVPTDLFTINGWKTGAIEPGEKQEIEVVFTPEDDKPYSGLVRVKNNLDNINNTIAVNGSGKKEESGHWRGRMIMTDREGLEPCQVDRDFNGELDYGVDCGTGGCQSCSRAIFGSSFASRGDVELHFSYSNEAINEDNFKINILIGGTNNRYVWACYKADIVEGSDFIVPINFQALAGQQDVSFQEINFEIKTETDTRIEGIWYGDVRAWDDHCLERCTGTWYVDSAESIIERCDFPISG